MVDSSGRETGQPIEMPFSDTKGGIRNGKIVTDDKGQIMWATTE